MDTLNFLELMAKYPHHSQSLSSLIDSQPSDVITAYKAKDSESLKKLIGESEYIANPSDVAQF